MNRLLNHLISQSRTIRRRTYGTLATAVALALLVAGCSISVDAVDEERRTPDAYIAHTGTPSPTALATATPTARPTATTRATARATATAAGTPAPTAQPSPTPEATSPASSPTPTEQPTPAPTTASEQRPTPTPRQPDPTPTPTPPPVEPTPTAEPEPVTCLEEPVRGFGLVWNDHPEIARQIGCPSSSEMGVALRVQQYQGGSMLWLDASASNPTLDTVPWVLTLIDGVMTRYRLPDVAFDWEPGLVEPTGAFKWVWDNAYADRERLGDAVTPYHESNGALQRFEQGMMLWLSAPPEGTLPVIYVVERDLVAAAVGLYQLYLDRGFQ